MEPSARPLPSVAQYRLDNMARKVPRPTADRGIVFGLHNIAAMMGVSTRTIIRWGEREGFPLATMPNEVRVTSERLVDYWLLSRVPNKRARVVVSGVVDMARPPERDDRKTSDDTKAPETHA